MIVPCRQPVDIGFPRSVRPSLDGVVEESPDAAPIIWVVLCCIDTSLGGNTVSPSCRVLNRKCLYIVPQLCQTRSCRSSCKAGSANNDIVFTFVIRSHQFIITEVIAPFILHMPSWNFGIYFHSLTAFR